MRLNEGHFMSLNQTVPLPLTDTTVIYICLLVGGIGLLVLWSIVIFGM